MLPRLFYSRFGKFNKRRIQKLTIKDDIKAINKDIFEAKDWEQMVQRAKYWLVKLKTSTLIMNLKLIVNRYTIKISFLLTMK